jgi:hypothetical protein
MPTIKLQANTQTPVQLTSDPYATAALMTISVDGPATVRLHDETSGGVPSAADVLASGIAITSARPLQLQDSAGRRPDFLWLLVDSQDASATAIVGAAW